MKAWKDIYLVFGGDASEMGLIRAFATHEEAVVFVETQAERDTWVSSDEEDPDFGQRRCSRSFYNITVFSEDGEPNTVSQYACSREQCNFVWWLLEEKEICPHPNSDESDFN